MRRRTARAVSRWRVADTRCAILKATASCGSRVEAAADIAKMIDIEPRSHITHCGTRTDVQLKGQKNPRAHPV